MLPGVEISGGRKEFRQPKKPSVTTFFKYSELGEP
jgi:hypothetical protein